MKIVRLALVLVIMGTAASVVARESKNEQPTFKHHRIGESAKEFFAIAMIVGHPETPTVDYCPAFLADPNTRVAAEQARAKQHRSDSEISAAVDLDGCQSVMDALSREGCGDRGAICQRDSDGQLRLCERQVGLDDVRRPIPF